MEKKNSVYAKLSQIQKAVRGLKKDSTGANNNYRFVSGDKVYDAIRPVMDELHLLLMPEVISHENTVQEYTVSSGRVKREVLTKVVMKMTWVDTETGDTVSCMWAGNGMNDWDKGFGSAITYGIRYYLLKTFMISTDEDDIDNIRRDDQQPNTPSVSEAPDPNRPWLEDVDGALESAKDYISKGGSIDAIYQKYRMKKTTKDLLIKQQS